ncbi:MAG TPA: NAD-dependent epimerase/dehydratase family protein [Bacteroidales bacterium]|nr:NAD-dependent epimerase/dehydratase family protein [Bacteroidales bacterium]
MDLQTILGSGGSMGTLLAHELSNYTSGIRLVARHPQKVNRSDELFTADLTMPGMIDQAIAGSKVVYLTLGMEYRLSVWESRWPALMRATIESCVKHNARLVFFDNIYMYDIDSVGHMTEESAMNPPSSKGMIRKTLVKMLESAIRSGRLKALIARSADFYGPGKDNILFNRLVYDRITSDQKAMWFINADKKHSFTHTVDAARGTALLGNTDNAFNQIWHLPTSSNTLTIRELASIVAQQHNKIAKIFIIPEWFIKLTGVFNPLMKEMKEMLYQYDRDYVFDSSKFITHFNYKPLAYSEGLSKMTVGSASVVEYSEV